MAAADLAMGRKSDLIHQLHSAPVPKLLPLNLSPRSVRQPGSVGANFAQEKNCKALFSKNMIMLHGYHGRTFARDDPKAGL